MWGNKPFRNQLISGVLRSPIQILLSVAMTLMSYYYGNYFGDYMLYMIVFGGAIFGGQFIAMALVPKLTEKHDKTRMLIGSTIMSAVPFALIYPVYLLRPGIWISRCGWQSCLWSLPWQAAAWAL